MKYLPWCLLLAALALPLLPAQVRGTFSTLRGPLKVLGQPAEAEWIMIESDDGSGTPTTYVVPPGKSLTLRYIWAHDLVGKVAPRITVAGRVIEDSTWTKDGGLHWEIWEFFPGAVAKQGETVAVENLSQFGPTASFFVRGWLEDNHNGRPARGVVRIMGQPAASDWVCLPSSLGGQFIVPLGMMLHVVSVWVPENYPGSWALVSLEGRTLFAGALSAGEQKRVIGHSFLPQSAVYGFQAREGQVVTIDDGGGPGPFILRGWLEDIP